MHQGDEMDQISTLQKCMREVEEESSFKGYWFRIGDVLSIIIYGMLCGLENVSEIQDWATAKPVRAFFSGAVWHRKPSLPGAVLQHFGPCGC
jgi:hypothetical protein